MLGERSVFAGQLVKCCLVHNFKVKSTRSKSGEILNKKDGPVKLYTHKTADKFMTKSVNQTQFSVHASK